MTHSIFMDKTHEPTNEDLQQVLGDCTEQWEAIRQYVLKGYPQATEEWNFSGAKYGWSFRMKDKKRAIIYLLPRENYFLVALVYGEKATNQVRNSNVSPEIKHVIETAPVYAEGRGFRIAVTGKEKISDIERLIDIKLAN